MTKYDDEVMIQLVNEVLAGEGIEGDARQVMDHLSAGTDRVLDDGIGGLLQTPGATKFLMGCMSVQIGPERALEALAAARVLLQAPQVDQLHRNRIEALFDDEDQMVTVSNTMIYATAMIRSQSEDPRAEMRENPEDACLVFAAVGYLVAARARTEPVDG